MPRAWSLILAIMGMGVSVLAAKDLTDYQVGDVADRDIVTPVALNVMDPSATAELRSSEADKTPAVFRCEPGVTNALTAEFQQAFEATHVKFVDAIQEEFHRSVLDHAAITSPDFDYLVTAFNIDNRKFPIPTGLAMDWAYGKDGNGQKQKWLNYLLDAMQNPIRPDEVPSGLNLSDTVRVVTVKDAQEKLTVADVQARGQLVPTLNLLTLSQARANLHREFSGYDEQALVRVLSSWLEPNYVPDAALTQAVRDQAVHQLVVGEYYNAGQLIVAKGEVINEKDKAALNELQQRMTPVTVTTAAIPLSNGTSNELSLVANADLPAPIAQVKAVTQTKSNNTDAETQPATVTVSMDNGQANAGHATAGYKYWLLGGSGVALALIGVMIGRLSFKRRRVLAATQVVKNIDAELHQTRTLQTELAPQLVQILRQAFVQELAGQRKDLLVVQQTAASEVIRLVQRMDELQVVMQERLRTYESHIRELESELTARTEENRQLIRLKIQMIRHQAEAESTRRLEFN